jgi:glutamate synthase domain-containing protein 2
MRSSFYLTALAILAGIAIVQFVWPPVLWALVIAIPFTLTGIYDSLQSRHSLRRNFPLYARIRWAMEILRPFLHQYFVESDTDGTPISRMFRNIVYQRAKGDLESVPFGTRLDTYRSGYEWIGHSIAAISSAQIQDLRIEIGGPHCSQPYLCSIFNISAMSFGALSGNAILALNRGARLGNFAHNTGEGGISPYHLEAGGDLVWQIGTGYFGCRDGQGNFAADAFAQKARLAVVRMIEIKLSQGAKPGHGGILPAEKNTPEIAAMRGVLPATQVDSPAAHSAFDSPRGLLLFVQQLRVLSGGKPIGIKLAIGRKSEFVGICKAMVASGITLDFITVDGGEGGTGAAPLEYINSVGMPLREALAFVDDCLTGFGLRRQIKVIAAGKILTGFHLVQNLALGADICNSGRGMMLALGCVQSLVCNTNHCPTGVATQDPKLAGGLVVTDKAQRVASFHQKTVHATAELIASAGLRHTSELNRSHIYRRVDQQQIRRFDEIFPYLAEGALLHGEPPQAFARYLREASPDSFRPRACMTLVDNEPRTLREPVAVTHLHQEPALEESL